MLENKQQSETAVVINDKAQGSVAIDFRCGGIFSYHFIGNSMLSLLNIIHYALLLCYWCRRHFFSIEIGSTFQKSSDKPLRP